MYDNCAHWPNILLCNSMLSRGRLPGCQGKVHAYSRIYAVNRNCFVTDDGKSKQGKTFINGKCLGSDLRNLIIDDFLAAGGDPEMQCFPGKFNDIADKFKISNSTVRKLWNLFCSTNKTTPRPRGGGNPSHLTHEDLRLIEVLVDTDPTVSLHELQVEIENYGDAGIYGRTSTGFVKHRRMTSGEYTRKKLQRLQMNVLLIKT